VITTIGLLYSLFRTVSSAYWVFAALATEVYLIMYVLMFVAAVRLRRNHPDHPRGYRAPALITICTVGTVASLAACVVGLLPPSQLGHASTPLYASGLLAAVLLVGVLPPALLSTDCAGPDGRRPRPTRTRPIGTSGCLPCAATGRR
jgi:glutamate:GABA antiporter